MKKIYFFCLFSKSSFKSSFCNIIPGFFKAVKLYINNSKKVTITVAIFIKVLLYLGITYIIIANPVANNREYINIKKGPLFEFFFKKKIYFIQCGPNVRIIF